MSITATVKETIAQFNNVEPFNYALAFTIPSVLSFGNVGFLAYYGWWANWSEDQLKACTGGYAV